MSYAARMERLAGKLAPPPAVWLRFQRVRLTDPRGLSYGGIQHEPPGPWFQGTPDVPRYGEPAQQDTRVTIQQFSFTGAEA
jgi:hypothetical protein